MATQRKLQPAAHADRMNGGDDRLGRVFDRQNHAQQIGFLQRLGAAKLLDVGTPRKRFAGAGDDDGLDGGVGIGLGQPIGDADPRGIAQAIDGRVVQRDHGDVALYFVFSGHACVPQKVK